MRKVKLQSGSFYSLISKINNLVGNMANFPKMHFCTDMDFQKNIRKLSQQRQIMHSL